MYFERYCYSKRHCVNQEQSWPVWWPDSRGRRLQLWCCGRLDNNVVVQDPSHTARQTIATCPRRRRTTTATCSTAWSTRHRRTSTRTASCHREPRRHRRRCRRAPLGTGRADPSARCRTTASSSSATVVDVSVRTLATVASPCSDAVTSAVRAASRRTYTRLLSRWTSLQLCYMIDSWTVTRCCRCRCCKPNIQYIP